MTAGTARSTACKHVGMSAMRTIQQLNDLRGRRALVTGGAGHVGGAAAEALVELGALVAIVDRDQASSARRARELSALRSGAALAIAGDLEEEEATRAAVREAERALGGLDILVHAAGYVGSTSLPGWSEPFARQTVGAWDRALRVNLTAGFILAQEAAPLLKRSGHGSIILIASIYGLVGPNPSLYNGTSITNPVAYGASKGGLRQLARYLATELAPDVRANLISPGGIARGQPPAFVERYEARTPLRRMASEEDIKGAIAYLASDLSAYVTGQELIEDGGFTAW